MQALKIHSNEVVNLWKHFTQQILLNILLRTLTNYFTAACVTVHIAHNNLSQHQAKQKCADHNVKEGCQGEYAVFVFVLKGIDVAF